MLNVLLESRAPRTRRTRSTVASALVHGVLVSAAVALTMPGPVTATAVTKPDSLIFVVPPHRTVHPPTIAVPAPPQTARGDIFTPSIPYLPVIPTTVPAIDVGPSLPTDDLAIGGPAIGSASPIGGEPGAGADGAPVDERLVERAPRLLGRAIEPRYPASLRDAGVQGRVVVQFVVDTLGRPELAELQVVESPHALFTDAVRAALARYRFSAGETGGRKVRTRVQIPFAFTLVR